MKLQYDIFISYRRNGGAQYARILQLMLQQRGYNVFLDYDELKDGIFGKRIKAAISAAPIFILVLSRNSMNRCVNEDDWLREEISHAIHENKHIIPLDPDKSFDGVPEDVPKDIKAVAYDYQRSELDFGQALGVTVDLMVKDRIAPILGIRTVQRHKDKDFSAAQETLRKNDAHNLFMKRICLATAIILIFIALGMCTMFWYHQRQKEAHDTMRTELEKKHEEYGLKLSPQLSETQMKAIDGILSNMEPVIADTLSISKFEFTTGQWYGVLDEDYDENKKDMPMTDVSFGEVYMTLIDNLRNMTGIEFDLPSKEEWNYAARGASNHESTLYVGSNDVNAVAWYKDNSEGRSHPSDSRQGKECNTLDLYDMSGNVSEMCNSTYKKNKNAAQWTVCGGNFDSPASEVTVSSCQGIDADKKYKTVGFRLIIRK